MTMNSIHGLGSPRCSHMILWIVCSILSFSTKLTLAFVVAPSNIDSKWIPSPSQRMSTSYGHVRLQQQREMMIGTDTYKLFNGQKTTRRERRFSTVPLQLSYNNNDNDYNNNNQLYDMTRKQFDLYSLRSVRGDALLKYNNLNQSEPLRINLSILIVLTLISSPWLLPELFTADNDSVQQTIAGIGIGTIASISLFIREVTRRTKQLIRLERELELQNLYVQLPYSSLIVASTMNSILQKQPISIQQLLRTDPTIRLLILNINDASIQQRVIQQLSIYSNRLVQSNTCVILVQDGKKESSNISSKENNNDRKPIWRQWLGYAYNVKEWDTYFTSLDNDNSNKDSTSSSNTESDSFKWLCIAPGTGRVIASGTEEPQSWLQLFGRYIRPSIVTSKSGFIEDILGIPYIPQLVKEKTITTDTTSTTDSSRCTDDTIKRTETILLQLQQQFYSALTQGNVTEMNNIFAIPSSTTSILSSTTNTATTSISTSDTTSTATATASTSQQVQDVMNQGGRLDSWKFCLQDGNRPSGMKISSVDCTIITAEHNDNNNNNNNNYDVAYTTAIEYPVIETMATTNLPTLLAIQEWRKYKTTTGSTSSSSSSLDEWKLYQHQTIPWTDQQKAGGMLLCDSRGCVSLVASK